jgi:hypothetical protein
MGTHREVRTVTVTAPPEPPGIEHLATIVEVPDRGPVTRARAYITYAPKQVPGHEWNLIMEYYPEGFMERYAPSEIGDGYYEWLGDAMCAVSNAIRTRGLVHCEVSVSSVGQPPMAHKLGGEA